MQFVLWSREEASLVFYAVLRGNKLLGGLRLFIRILMERKEAGKDFL